MGVDIVFEQYGYPVHGAALFTFLKLSIKLFRYGQGIRIGLNDGVKHRTAVINGSDTVKIGLHHFRYCEVAIIIALLKLSNRVFFKTEVSSGFLFNRFLIAGEKGSQ